MQMDGGRSREGVRERERERERERGMDRDQCDYEGHDRVGPWIIHDFQLLFWDIHSLN